MILPPAKKTKAEAHRIVIVPRGSADASALGHELPKIVDFSLPDKKPGSDELGGRHGHETSPQDTYLSLFKEVCNERLEGCSKSVVQFGEKDDLTLSRAMLHSDEAISTPKVSCSSSAQACSLAARTNATTSVTLL